MSAPTPPTPPPLPTLNVTTPASLSNPNGGTCAVSASQNALLSVFNQLVTDSNTLLISRAQAQIDTEFWNFYNAEIGYLVNLAKEQGAGLNQGAYQRSLIYGRIMLIITSQYLPAVSTYLGDQIAEQASIENIASDISGFVLEAQNGFNTLSSTPDCSCTECSCATGGCSGCSTSGSTTSNICSTTTDCLNDYNFYSGIMTLVAGNASYAPVSGANFSFNFNVSVTQGSNSTATEPENNVLAFLTDPVIWGSTSSTPLSSTEASQISTALLGIAQIFSPSSTTANVNPNTWQTMNLTNIASATCSWTQPYGSSTMNSTVGSSNAPLVYTQPSTIQGDLNTAAQTVQGVSTTTQTQQNFIVQEIDQFYGITNSIQQSQEQQCASMVKQQTT